MKCWLGNRGDSYNLNPRDRWPAEAIDAVGNLQENVSTFTRLEWELAYHLSKATEKRR